MHFRILGALAADTDDGGVVELGPPKQRALLAILLLHAGEIVSTDRLIDMLWGESPPRTAAHSIQIYVSELRKSLETLTGAHLIVTRPPGYELQAEPGSIDAREFERLVADGVREVQAGNHEAGAALIRSALALWRGPALSDFVYEDFAQPYISRLQDLHLDAIEELAFVELETGATAEVVTLLDAAILEDPLRERSRELLMLALYRSGRHAEALRTYERLRTLLDEELGLEPSPPIRRMQERILVHDPALLVEPDTAVPMLEARNPYKGLRPFGEDDASDYFGREALLDALLDRLRTGAHLTALVGPSGSGKSSILAAGLIPRLRAGAIPGSERWVVARFTPGARPLEQVAAELSKVGSLPLGLAELIDTNLRTMPDDGRLLLAIDQFEEVFSIADEQPRRRFLQSLASAVTRPDSQVFVVLALRADFYDRPLTYPSFAEAFTPSVMNVLPMTKLELEAAVSGPAEGVGVAVEPLLVAELVAETADQAGALPILQYALTELFDQRDGPSLTLSGYRALGGLRGLLSRRAESLYAGLSDDQQRAAMQVFMRLVRLGRGAVDTRQRVPLSDLVDLDIDSVILSDVLGAFGSHRLLSFDRDATAGRATVEVAHEALLREWDRLVAWIDQHRTALRRHEVLRAAVEEWELTGRNSDYLLTGGRLSEFEQWRADGTLQLTSRERAFLDAATDQRSAHQAEEAAREVARQRLERRARIRLIALVVAVALLGGAVIYGVWATSAGHVPRVALLHPGVAALDSLNEDGFDRAVADFGLAGKERLYDEREGVATELRGLAADGAGLIILAGAAVEDLEPVVRDYPNTRFVLDGVIKAPNVATITYATKEGSFLAGAAAALTSKSKIIGFIGGVDHPYMWQFQAGFEAGALSVDANVQILAAYLARPPDFDEGFSNPTGALEAAKKMYDAGADVIFHAAGGSGIGVFQAAAEMSNADSPLWAIGVDSDQFETVRLLTGVIDPDAWRAHILTSVVLRQDLAVYAVLKEFTQGEFIPGTHLFGLASEGVGLSYSGGFIADLRPQIDAFRQGIIDGTITVPCVPRERTEEAARFPADQLACTTSD